MSRLEERHKKLVNGHAPCSVPMWSMGCPAGFCDEIAFGKQTKEYLSRFPRYDRYHRPAYCPEFACHGHGGPREHAELLVFRDGAVWCAARREGFTNIQECDAAFGRTAEEAIDRFYESQAALARAEGRTP